MSLKKISMQFGTAASPKELSSVNVDTLCAVYADSSLTLKSVTGYGHATSITKRKKWMLQQLGLTVTQDSITAQEWAVALTKNTLSSGESTTVSAAFTETGGADLSSEMTVTIQSVTVNYGSVSRQTAEEALSLSGRVLTFSPETGSAQFACTVVLSVKPAWDDAKTVTVNAHNITDLLTTVINNDNLSAALTQTGSRTWLTDYISRCKPYVLTADGSKKAEIASATFEGAYSGMTSGTVTFKDGTVKSITELNGAGCNFMIYRPDLYIWSGTEGGLEKFKLSGIYDIGSTKKFPGKYIGMFKAFSQDNVLKSQPNRIPTGSKTIAAFQQEAKAGGTDWGLWNYTDWCRENALHLAYFHNTNYESNVGVGRINNYSNVRNIVTGFTLPLLASPLACGVKASPDSAGNSVNSLMFFGIEGMGEQIWVFVIGFRHDGVGNAVIWDENDWNEGHTGRALTLPVTSANSSYIKKIIAGAEFDLMPKTVGGSSTSGMCDGHLISASGRLLCVGGAANVGSICGLSASVAGCGFGYADAGICARLAFYGSPVEVAGANLI